MPYGVDQNVAIVRNDRSNIRMIAENNAFVSIFVISFRKGKNICPSTRRANIAGLAGYTVQTDKRFNQLERKLPFADSVIAREKQRIGHTPIRQKVPQRLFDVFVSNELFKHSTNQLPTTSEFVMPLPNPVREADDSIKPQA